MTTNRRTMLKCITIWAFTYAYVLKVNIFANLFFTSYFSTGLIKHLEQCYCSEVLHLLHVINPHDFETLTILNRICLN